MTQKTPTVAPPLKPVQPVVLPPKDTILAAFTPRELDILRKLCRDSDDEMVGKRALEAALTRAGK